MHRLGEDQIEHYRVEGYVVAESVFGGEDLVDIDAAIRELTEAAVAGERGILELEPEPVDGRRVARRIYDPYDRHRAFRAIANDARVTDRIESLIGPDFNLQHSKL